MKADPIIGLQKQLHRRGYITRDREFLTKLHNREKEAETTPRPLACQVLDGPPGTGKTFGAETFADYWQGEVLFYQCTRGVGKEDFLYDMNIPNIVAAQTGKWDGHFTPKHALMLGLLPRALELSKQRRVVLIIDEIDKAQPNVDTMLLDFLNSARVVHPTLGGFDGNPHNLMVFITKNSERDITDALMRRGQVHYMGFPDPETEAKLIVQMALKYLRHEKFSANLDGMAKVIVSYANRVRRHANTLKKVPSSPELAAALRDAVWSATPDRGAVVYSWLLKYASDIAEMRDHWSESPETIGKALKPF